MVVTTYLFDYKDMVISNTVLDYTKKLLVLYQEKELNKMWFFFQISALKILVVATALPIR